MQVGEYLALMHLVGRLEQTTPALFAADYRELLAAARARLAAGWEGDLPEPVAGPRPRGAASPGASAAAGERSWPEAFCRGAFVLFGFVAATMLLLAMLFTLLGIGPDPFTASIGGAAAVLSAGGWSAERLLRAERARP